MVEVPDGLKARYQEGRLIPFIGSGVSSSVVWADGDAMKRGVSWTALVDEAAKILGFAEPDLLRERGTDLQILEYFRIKNGDNFAALRRWFDREMLAPNDALESSEILKGLANLKACDVFYTTNFDDFLERGLSLHGRESNAIASELDISTSIANGRAGDRRVAKVLKFHGDLDHPDSMVLSERDYEDRLAFDDVQDVKFRADLLGRALLFIGYSFSDWNVTYLFRLFNDRNKNLPATATGHRAYIAFPDPSEFEYRLFEQRNVHVIPIRSGHREADISALLKELSDG